MQNSFVYVDANGILRTQVIERTTKLERKEAKTSTKKERKPQIERIKGPRSLLQVHSRSYISKMRKLNELTRGKEGLKKSPRHLQIVNRSI